MYDPAILGVLNLSADSTTKVSVARTTDELLQRARHLADAGATYIDIGARSTGEFAARVSDEAECELLLPGLRTLKRAGFRVSADTWSPQTAVQAVRAGADMLNFTGGVYTDEMLQSVQDAGAELAISYMPYGDPYQMRDAEVHRPTPHSICEYFAAVLQRAAAFRLPRVILDPNAGILHHRISGREKLAVQATVISSLHLLRPLGRPLMMHSARQDDANGRAVYAAFVIGHRPDYIRTHYPDLIKEMLGYANHA